MVPASLQPLGVRDHAGLTVDLVGRDAIQRAARLRPLDEELRHEGHVHQPDGLAYGAVLRRPSTRTSSAAPTTARPRAARPRPARTSRPPSQPLTSRKYAPSPPAGRGSGDRFTPARGQHRSAREVRLVDHAERLDGALGPVPRVELVVLHAIDVEAGDVDVGPAVDDPLRHDAAHATAGEDADRVHAGRNEVVVEAGRLADDGREVRRERLRAAEEGADARLQRDRHPLHRPLDVGAHPVPVGRDLPEREVVRDALDLPRRADRLEEPDHQTAALLAVVAVTGRVLEHRPRRDRRPSIGSVMR